jgi:hypothetical protein
VSTAEACLAAARAVSPEPSDFFGSSVGVTGYLDGEFIPKRSVSHGVDRFGRPYITLCVALTGRRGTAYAVFTAFRRYAHGSDVWTYADNVEMACLGLSQFSRDSFEALRKLISGERVRFPQSPIDRFELATPEEVRAHTDGSQEIPDAPRGATPPSAALHAWKPQMIETIV